MPIAKFKGPRGARSLRSPARHRFDHRRPFAAVGVDAPVSFAKPERPQINAVASQQVEGHVRRAATSRQQLVEKRAASVIEHDKFAIEDMALRQQSSTRSNRCIRLPLREISRSRTVSAAARKPSNLVSKNQSAWSNGSAPSTPPAASRSVRRASTWSRTLLNMMRMSRPGVSILASSAALLLGNNHVIHTKVALCKVALGGCL
jgi:hypothetical protein